MSNFRLSDLVGSIGEAIHIDELDQRLEMGIWFFDTHEGTSASCGAGDYSGSHGDPSNP